jgi:hypothetical protein
MKHGLGNNDKYKHTDFEEYAPKVSKDRQCDRLIDRRECDFRKTIKDIVKGFPHV